MKKLVVFFLLIGLVHVCHSQKIRVIGNSKLAKIAARLNRQDSYGITIGRMVFVSCKKDEFYAKKWWVKHEFTHVAQYQKLGVLRFLSLYAYYSIFHHHAGNPFEKEAEDAEYSSD